ncbi:hypothetical protein L3X38_004419 [Prunus dulcis]|uniref:Reverse transcriptase/retrotransposon-derived protein RNase H-like domain-containing protein n=1 Tax=Prunus dulcis TaxID=3755 RepID=A0AAD5F393_PRUDU|nr:hypothetical protein L3X38_004419 [Prunus dulcis]
MEWLVYSIVPDDSGNFVIYSDASQQGLGCVLMQHDLYGSQEFKVFIHPEGTEFEGKKMVRVHKRLWLYHWHHPGRANVVADALSKKSSRSVAYLRGRYLPLMVEMRKLRVGLGMDNQGARLAALHVRPVLVERILAAQSQDPLICTL